MHWANAHDDRDGLQLAAHLSERRPGQRSHCHLVARKFGVESGNRDREPHHVICLCRFELRDDILELLAMPFRSDEPPEAALALGDDALDAFAQNSDVPGRYETASTVCGVNKLTQQERSLLRNVP